MLSKTLSMAFVGPELLSMRRYVAEALPGVAGRKSPHAAFGITMWIEAQHKNALRFYWIGGRSGTAQPLVY